jgi:O-antigen/teichoic acid export membrane protein
MARTLIRAVVSLALLPLLIDRIGAASTGLFVVATTLTGYFTAVEYGLGTSVTKYVAEHRATGDGEQLGSVLRASLLLMLGLGVLIAVILALLGLLGGPALFTGPSLHSQAVPTLLTAAVAALFYWPSRLGTAALEGIERYDLNAVVQSVCSILMFTLIYATTEWSHSVALLTGIFCATLVLEGLCAGALAWPHLGVRRGVGSWRGAHLRPALGFGAGLFVMGLAGTLTYESDRIVVTAFVGAAAVVIYEVALRPQNGMRLIHGLIGAALVSTCSRLVAQGRVEELRKLVLVGSLYGIILTEPLVVLTMVLARPILNIWVGHGYVRYASYVQIFASYWIIGASAGMLSTAVVGVGRIRIFVWISAISAIVTLGLSIWLTAEWGTIGVILGTVIPAWIAIPVSMPYYLRHVGISKGRFVREVLLPGYLPVAGWAIVVLAGNWTLHPSGVLGLGAFCAISLAILWLAQIPILRASWQSIGLAGQISTVRPLPAELS